MRQEDNNRNLFYRDMYVLCRFFFSNYSVIAKWLSMHISYDSRYMLRAPLSVLSKQ